MPLTLMVDTNKNKTFQFSDSLHWDVVKTEEGQVIAPRAKKGGDIVRNELINIAKLPFKLESGLNGETIFNRSF